MLACPLPDVLGRGIFYAWCRRATSSPHWWPMAWPRGTPVVLVRCSGVLPGIPRLDNCPGRGIFYLWPIHAPACILRPMLLHRIYRCVPAPIRCGANVHLCIYAQAAAQAVVMATSQNRLVYPGGCERPNAEPCMSEGGWLVRHRERDSQLYGGRMTEGPTNGNPGQPCLGSFRSHPPRQFMSRHVGFLI